MILRESHPGEKITTLDGITRTLPGGDIVIEDGSGRLIDLCGIMGGQNSEITPQTKRVLLFVQSYDPVRIRRTCMSLAHRTEAATRFEKGVDTENVIPVLWRGVNILQKNANAHLASNLIDIYPNPYRPKKVALDFEFANKRIGLKIPPPEIKKILTSLGFEISFTEKNLFATIPSHRTQDISLESTAIIICLQTFPKENFPNKRQIPAFSGNRLPNTLLRIGVLPKSALTLLSPKRTLKVLALILKMPCLLKILLANNGLSCDLPLFLQCLPPFLKILPIA
jgi:phenylalanyl-tRNA synthetase beta chain